MASSNFMKKQLEAHVKCPVCLEAKELRLLPCQHRICFDCLKRLHTYRRLVCPECRFSCQGSLDSFKVCRLTKALQNDILSSTLGTGDDALACEVDGCQRRVEARCKACQIFLCYRCFARQSCNCFRITIIAPKVDDLDSLVEGHKGRFKALVSDTDREIKTLAGCISEEETRIQQLRSELEALEQENNTKKHQLKEKQSKAKEYNSVSGDNHVLKMIRLMEKIDGERRSIAAEGKDEVHLYFPIPTDVAAERSIDEIPMFISPGYPLPIP